MFGPLALALPTLTLTLPTSCPTAPNTSALLPESHKRHREAEGAESHKAETGRQSKLRRDSEISSPFGAGALRGPSGPHDLFQAWGGGGWKISEPCEEWIAIAFGNAYKLSHKATSNPFGSSSSGSITMRHLLQRFGEGRRSCAWGPGGCAHQCLPPPPPLATCFRHRALSLPHLSKTPL